MQDVPFALFDETVVYSFLDSDLQLLGRPPQPGYGPPLLTTCPSDPPSPQLCSSIPTHPLLQSPDPIWLQSGCPNQELGGPPFTPHPGPSRLVHPHICGCCRGSAPRHPRVFTRWFQGAPVLQGYTPGWPCASSSIAAPTLHPLGPARHPDWSPVGHRLIFIC